MEKPVQPLATYGNKSLCSLRSHAERARPQISRQAAIEKCFLKATKFVSEYLGFSVSGRFRLPDGQGKPAVCWGKPVFFFFWSNLSFIWGLPLYLDKSQFHLRFFCKMAWWHVRILLSISLWFVTSLFVNLPVIYKN